MYDVYWLRHRPCGKRSGLPVGTWGEPQQLNSQNNDKEFNKYGRGVS